MYEELKRILGEIDLELGKGNSDDVIARIEEGLKKAGYDYIVEEWKKEGKSNINYPLVNYLFPYAKFNITLLHIAAQNNYKNVVETFLGIKGIHVNAEDRNGAIPLHWAVKDNAIDVVTILVQAEDIEVNAQNKNGNTPLHWVVVQGNAEIVNALVEKGADVNAQNKNGNTPLHFAVVEDNAEIVNAL
ncbi:Ankyrin repeat-containing domain,Ankyrin repeat, partial [Cinara cedri]